MTVIHVHFSHNMQGILKSIEMEINNLPYKSDGKDSSKRLTMQLGERFTGIDRRKFMRKRDGIKKRKIVKLL